MLVQKEWQWHCVGCGRPILWNGKSAFAYTCLCGATIFADEKHKPALPASLILAVREGREISHVDYYLGISNYVSVEKQSIYEELKKLGAIWSWKCKKCQDRFLKQIKVRYREGLLNFELLPELKALLEAYED